MIAVLTKANGNIDHEIKKVSSFNSCNSFNALIISRANYTIYRIS